MAFLKGSASSAETKWEHRLSQILAQSKSTQFELHMIPDDNINLLTFWSFYYFKMSSLRNVAENTQIPPTTVMSTVLHPLTICKSHLLQT